ncbi:HD domain-containing protein [Brucepastera parasyntrophica]|uniref:HD-GYP domain-containing protein n=1 Tax=Brucepastera parasyntrophica TaxID=2880008 RepID=UPI00210BE29F|nr:HD domain-containing phosphohydrolase [Brucepastera parasyntrophica]ULQ58791.1 HD domain-containing protein [Brucepastera parasyntrophica]
MKNDFSLTTANDDFLELTHQFSLDEIDDWHTTAALIESTISVMNARIPGTNSHIFIHISESHEYREPNNEGIATIPEESLFIACLSMLTEGLELSNLFTDYQIDDPLLQELLSGVYRGRYIVPVVHRFRLLAFILLCDQTPDNSMSPPFLDANEIRFIGELTTRLRINLYAALISDRRQRELLRLAEYPAILHKRTSVADLTKHILEDCRTEISFDCGVYYEYDETDRTLLPVAWDGTGSIPDALQAGQGISGLTLERKRAIYVSDRSKHASFALMDEEPFINGSFVSAPIFTDNQVLGVITLSRTPHNPDGFGAEHRYTLEIATAFIASEINNRHLFDELEQSYFSTVTSLTRTLEAKDRYTRGHSERVMKFALGVAEELKMPAKTLRQIQYAALLHDIGKIGISDAIINKAMKLTEEEYAEIQRHTEIGYEIVSNINFFGEIRDLIKYHHERLDGKGYYGKKAGEYPRETMIISIADIYDALTSDRPYRAALTRSVALAILEKMIDIHFERPYYEALCRYLDKLPIHDPPVGPETKKASQPDGETPIETPDITAHTDVKNLIINDHIEKIPRIRKMKKPKPKHR